MAMLVGAILIVVNAPRCKPEPKPEWYQDTVVYEVDAKQYAGNFEGEYGPVSLFCYELWHFNLYSENLAEHAMHSQSNRRFGNLIRSKLHKKSFMFAFGV